MIDSLMRKNLEKQGYRLVGSHSAVKICTWTKKSLLNEDFCYKQKFYNIKSHMCCQMSPCLLCTNQCVFCWRDISLLVGDKLKSNDEPKDIIEGCISAQRKLIGGFNGNKKTDRKKFGEAQTPKYWAISLSGEPTIYEKLGMLIGEIKKRKDCSFLVTNGMFPKQLAKLDPLPTQLYVSLDAPTEKVYNKIDRPMMKDAWLRFNKTLELLPSLATRKVLRLTMVKGMNMCNFKRYASLIKKADPTFVEVKAFMPVGYARYRMKYEDMPTHTEVMEMSEKISEFTGLKVIDEKANSRVVLLAEKDSKDRKLKF